MNMLTAMLAAMAAGMVNDATGQLTGVGPLFPSSKQTVKVVDNPQYTRNLFGSISEIAGKTLELVERNQEGDCMCLFDGVQGRNLVDVDHRDIQP